LRADLGILEEQFVKIAEAKKQQRVRGKLAFDPPVLRHHGRELGFGRHRAARLSGNEIQGDGKIWRQNSIEIP
jgi:hypothetical protein